MASHRRLDRALVEEGLARSRGHAHEALAAGLVEVDGRVVTKAASPVTSEQVLSLRPGARHWVSRSAGKLDAVFTDLAARDVTAPVVDGRRCADLGASTGGFTQVLLERGAAHVVAIDVGHDQLAPEIAADPRVEDVSGTTLRGLDPKAVGGPVDLVVSDLSFISLRLVLPEIAALLRPAGEAVLLVKPQFEVGAGQLGPRGVVTDIRARRRAVLDVVEAMRSAGLGVRAVLPSAVRGGQGNREYLVVATRDHAVGVTWEAQQEQVARIFDEEGE